MITLPHGSKRCLCRDCLHVFSTPNAFDQHRKAGACVDPATAGLICRDGIWVREYKRRKDIAPEIPTPSPSTENQS